MPDPGDIELIAGKSSLVVAAPHGAHDKGTDKIAAKICRLTNAAGVIAKDFTNPATGHRLNINRPTEGAGVEPGEEEPTPLAARLFRKYLVTVMSAANRRLDHYVEVHGNTHPELANRIEVAVWGVPQQVTRKILTVFAPKVKATLGVELWIEGLAPIEKRAWASKLFGTLALASQSLHFELPIKTRATPAARKRTAALLAEMIKYWWLQAEAAVDKDNGW